MKLFKLKSLTLAMCLVVFPALASSAAEVKLWGSTTCQKRFLEPGAKALEEATGVKIKVLGVGTGKGMVALFEGKTNVAISSNTLEDSVKSAQKVRAEAGLEPIAVPEGLQFHTITEDIIVPIVHQDNPVAALSWDQLSDLNTGKVTNWKDVGGNDAAVKVITSHAGSSTKAVFQKMVMKKQEYSPSALEVKSTRLEINEVSADVGGIGAVSKGFVSLSPGNSKIIKTDTISRPLGLITIGDPSPDVQKIIDYFLSSEGQKQILD
ncbi:MAG: substrate-binding domain-containing protein [Proteobacteria bacterium]|nr:substrate-binding domain-containing protein [Pseudomonadota bacterium]MBU1058431.1 substrate-binding domain-containing protein [Pseudomonadota bacterium]